MSDKSAASKQQASSGSSGIGFNFTGDMQKHQLNEEPLKVALRENKEKDDLLKITDSRFESFEHKFITLLFCTVIFLVI